MGTAIGYLAPGLWGLFMGAGFERIPAMRLAFGILAVLATIFMLVPAFGINEKDYCEAQPGTSPVLKSLATTFKNKDFRVFVLQDIIYFLGLTMFQTGLPFFVTSLLRFDESMSMVMFVGLTAASLIFYPFITKLAHKIGKKALVVIAFIGFVITFGFTGICGKLLIAKVNSLFGTQFMYSDDPGREGVEERRLQQQILGWKILRHTT